ncbi:DNA recombination and repair protein RecF, partial [Salmonella enterica subsp. enterica serovar Rubislaw str. A4-653]
ESGRRCLYLIDDFASELDDARRGLLASRLKATQSQVFVSAISGYSPHGAHVTQLALNTL